MRRATALGERQEIVARTLRVRSLRHTECADYDRVSYFLPLALRLKALQVGDEIEVRISRIHRSIQITRDDSQQQIRER